MKIFSKRVLAATAISALVIGGFYFYESMSISSQFATKEAEASLTATITLPFKYAFAQDGTVNEVSNLSLSTSPYWWLSSGGELDIFGGTGKSIQGDLPIGSKWQAIYNLANPVETDKGLHPQNIFRLVMRTNWKDVSQVLYYKINKYILSASPNRASSNGLFQMTRYSDQYNLYYTGLRVDGYAVIKKKYLGQYYTMAYVKILPGTYNPLLNPNLLPTGTWIGMKTITKNLDATRVQIQIYSDIGRTGTWKLVASAIDDGKAFGGPVLGEGHVGVRTDFMDVEFDDYLLSNP